jgi:hypothetical protein
MEKVAYAGWPNCVRLSNDTIDLIVTTDVGPRIIRFGFVRGENEFAEFPTMVGKTGGKEWRIYGGHRLWHAPEDLVRSYHPDNEPVHAKSIPGGVRIVQPTESTTGIQKELDIRLAPDAARVEVTHRLRNRNLWPVDLAPWGLSVMAPGGKAILPLPPRLRWPESQVWNQTVTLWPYTDMADPRWTWGRQYILLRQDAKSTDPQKLGIAGAEGWAAYAREGHLFLKQYDYVPGTHYPDMNCAVETYTSNAMLELETLGPLVTLPAGGKVEHVERWFLFSGIPVPNGDDDVAAHIAPLAMAAK